MSDDRPAALQVSGSKSAGAAPPWVVAAAAVLVAGSCSQLAYALHPRKGPFLGYLEVLAAVFLGLWALWVLASGRLKHLVWPPWPVWAFVAVAFLSASKAVNLRAAGVEIAQDMLYFVGLYVLFATAARGGRRWIGQALTVAVTIATAAGLAQLLTGLEPMKVGGLMMDRNIYSAFLAFSLPVIWALACDAWPRPAGIAGALLVAAALMTMLGPPHIWIALIALGGVSALVLKGKFWAPTVGLLGLVIVVNFACPLHRACNVDELLNPWETGSVYKLLREVGASENQRLVKKRWLEWWPALAMMTDQPVLGVGAGNYQLNVGQAQYWGYLPNAKKTEPNTNNLYLVIGGSMGLAGLVSLVAILLYFLQAGAVQAKTGDPLTVGLFVGLAALTVVNVFTAVLVRGVAVAWMAMMAGIASAEGPDGEN